MTRRVWSPWSCWSLATSRSIGKDWSFCTNCGTQTTQLPASAIFEAVLKLGPAHPVFDRQILNRLHEERDALDLRQLRLQAANDVAGADPALLDRL